jgi:hypothetical protein
MIIVIVNTVRHWACFYGRPECLEALVELPGIEVNAVAEYFGSRTAIHVRNLITTCTLIC